MQAKVRNAEIADLERLVELGEDFHNESPYEPDTLDRTVLASYLVECITGRTHGYFVADLDGEVIGMACASTNRLYFSRSTYYAVEMFWYVTPDYRGGCGQLLLHAMENWASEQGCDYIVIGSFAGKCPDGYQPAENTYSRRLN